MHDPCVIGWLLWPELFEGRDCFVEVATENGPLRGRSTIDWNNRLKRPSNAFVVNTIKAEEFFDRLINSLSRLA
jgi:purine nucleosidase